MASDRQAVWHYARALRPVGFRTFDNVRVDSRFGSGLVADLLYGQDLDQNVEKLIFDLPTDLLSVDHIILRAVDLNQGGFTCFELSQKIEARTGVSTWVGVLMADESGIRVESDMTLRRGIAAYDLVPLVRQAELDAQLTWSGALMMPSDRHFELPSGTHASGFIRLGDALFDITFVERLADWFESKLKAADVLAADTWTLLPLLQELRERRDKHHGKRSAIRTFRGYPAPADFDQLMNAALVEVDGDEGGLLFILSVRSSSALLKNLRRAVHARLPRERVEIVTLVDTGDPPEQAFTRIDNIKRYNVPEREECLLCREPQKRLVVHVDTRKYIADVPRSDNMVMIRHDFASAHSELWEAADRQDAVRIHWQDPAGKRHHVIGFHVGKLLMDERFRRRTVSELRKCAPLADVVVIPEHEATEALVALAETAYHRPEIIKISDGAIGDGAPENSHLKALVKRLSEIKKSGEVEVLILDDALIQGRRIRSLHRLLQHAFLDIPARNYIIRAFAVVARPATRRRWERLCDSLRQGSRRLELGHAALVYLPDVASPRCPWCDEATQLKKVLDELGKARSELRTCLGIEEEELAAAEALVRERYEQLERAAGGSHLGGTIFFCDSRGDIGAGVPDQITRNSLFGDRLRSAAAFAAVAAAMQSIRNGWADAPAGTTHEWHTPRILGAYHDPLLSAAFLRAAYPEEMGVSGSSNEFVDAIDEISFVSTAPDLRQSPMLAMELEWAVIRGAIRPEFAQKVHQRASWILEGRPELMTVLDLLRVVLLPGGGAIPPRSPEAGQ